MADGGMLKSGLKWAFRIAVWGIGFGIGSELVTEFLTYGVMHGSTELSHALTYMSKEFTEPIMSSLNDAIGGEAGLGWLKSTLKGIHEMFGVTGTFEPSVLGDAGKSLIKEAAGVGGSAGLTMPGLD